LVEYSEDFSQWNTDGASSTVDYGYLSPRGDLTASKVTKQNSNGHLYIAGITGAKSIYIKGTTGETVSALDRHTDANTLITLTGEWQRVELNGVNSYFYAVDFRAGTATEVYLWGAQLEAGSVATSYIPTSGSTVTRAADDLVISGSDFTDFYNASEGTFYVEAVPQDGINEFPYYFEFSNGTTANRHHVYRNGTSGNTYSVNISGSTLFNTPIGSVTLDALNRISYSYKENDYLGSSNGATPAPETGAVPTGISQLLIGNSTASTPRLMTGRIKRLIYWPYHSDSL